MRNSFQLATVLLPALVNSASPRHLSLHYARDNLARQTQQLPECRYAYQTNVWTGCQDLLYTFGISLSYFRKVNPEISSTCDNYVAGNTYCLIRSKNNLPGW
jgi:hypothetical protein